MKTKKKKIYTPKEYNTRDILLGRNTIAKAVSHFVNEMQEKGIAACRDAVHHNLYN